MFRYSAIDNYTLQFSPNSNVNPNHLDYFKFIGRMVGMALYHEKILKAFFIRPVYKMIRQEKLTVEDVQAVDPEYYGSLQWILSNNLNDNEPLDMTFSQDYEEFGQVHTVDLVENGRNVPVTEENKAKFVELVVSFRLERGIKEQLTEFLKGLYEFIPLNVLQMFDAKELELLIGGIAGM